MNCYPSNKIDISAQNKYLVSWHMTNSIQGSGIDG